MFLFIILDFKKLEKYQSSFVIPLVPLRIETSFLAKINCFHIFIFFSLFDAYFWLLFMSKIYEKKLWAKFESNFCFLSCEMTIDFILFNSSVYSVKKMEIYLILWIIFKEQIYQLEINCFNLNNFIFPINDERELFLLWLKLLLLPLKSEKDRNRRTTKKD